MGGGATTEHINQAMNEDVAEPLAPSTASDLKRAFPSRDALRYIANSTFIADPSKLLGRVYYEKRGQDALIPFSTRVTVKTDESSRLSAPQTVSELVIDSKASASADFLSLVSLNVGADDVFELRVIDNAAARAIDNGDEWDAAVTKWYENPRSQELLRHPDVAAISVVTGVVQKYLTSKKYRKFEAGAKGGNWGVNVAGNLYTSSSEFQLDVVYGVDLVSFGIRDEPAALEDKVSQVTPMTRKADISEMGDRFTEMARDRGFALRR